MIRKAGGTAQVVEKFNQFSMTRLDLFGCIDIVAMIDGSILGVQACAGASHAARKEKSLAQPYLEKWLACGARFQVVSWSKRVSRNSDGKKSKVLKWTPRVEEIIQSDFIPTFKSKPTNYLTKPIPSPIP